MKSKFTKMLPVLMLLLVVVLLPVKASAANKRVISDATCKFKLSYTECVFDGQPHKPNVKVVYKGKIVLVKNKDYKLSYNDVFGPGKVKVGITGIGKYQGKVIKYYKILESKKVISAKTCKFKLSQTVYTYDGKSHKPNAAVYYGGKKLTKNKDFKLIYSKNTVFGKAKIGIVGIGVYSGKVVFAYKILKAQKITLSKLSFSTNLVNGSYTIIPTTNGNVACKYKSSNTSIATVSSKGKVVFKKAGVVKIKVVAPETSKYQRAAQYVVIDIEKATKSAISTAKAKAAVVWAKKIAADNSFHYGVKSSKGGWANHHGCYFCGTNGTSSSKYKEAIKKGFDKTVIKQIKKSYCCNPFITACYCHGAATVKFGNDITQFVSCKSKRINLADDKNNAVYNTKAFKKIKKPAKVSSLKVGDVLLASNHAMIYAGNNQIVESSGGDDGKVGSDKWNNSIRVSKLTESSYWWGHIKKIYRYIGG